jgi:hypothetical protein
MEKTWQRRSKGIWQHSSGMLYERLTIEGRRTFRSLRATNLESAQKEQRAPSSGVEDGVGGRWGAANCNLVGSSDQTLCAGWLP